MIENVKKDKMIPLLAAPLVLHWLLTALGYHRRATKGVCYGVLETHATQVNGPLSHL